MPRTPRTLAPIDPARPPPLPSPRLADVKQLVINRYGQWEDRLPFDHAPKRPPRPKARAVPSPRRVAAPPQPPPEPEYDLWEQTLKPAMVWLGHWMDGELLAAESDSGVAPVVRAERREALQWTTHQVSALMRAQPDRQIEQLWRGLVALIITTVDRLDPVLDAMRTLVAQERAHEIQLAQMGEAQQQAAEVAEALQAEVAALMAANRDDIVRPKYGAQRRRRSATRRARRRERVGRDRPQLSEELTSRREPESVLRRSRRRKVPQHLQGELASRGGAPLRGHDGGASEDRRGCARAAAAARKRRRRWRRRAAAAAGTSRRRFTMAQSRA